MCNRVDHILTKQHNVIPCRFQNDFTKKKKKGFLRRGLIPIKYCVKLSAI